ncbi:MAG: hypothetical protein RQ867_08375 [Mariprofundaceae bacterium]|nr:hypothetical protein [Mariprofundaceae bacterium]
MYSCKEASRIASDSLDRKLTWSEWVNMKLHLAMCRLCRNFDQNIRFINTIMKRRRKTLEKTRLSSQQKETLTKNVVDAIKQED